MKKSLLFGALLASMGAQIVIGGQLLTPDEAITIALKNNYAIIIAEKAAQTTKINNHAGNADMLPLASLTASDNLLVTRPLFGGASPESYRKKTNVFSAGARLDWTIFDGGRMFITRKKLGDIETLGVLNFRNEVMNTASAVIVGYYDVVRQKQILASIREVIRYNSERVGIAQTGFDAGLIPKTVLLQATIDLNVYRGKAIDQSTAVIAAKRALNQVLCRDGSVEFEVLDTIPPVNLPEQEVVRNKIDSYNNLVLSYRKQLDLAQLTLQENRALLFPKVAVTAGYGYTSNSLFESSPDNSVWGPQAGAAITVPLFQGGKAVRRLATDRIAVETAETKLESVRLQVRYQLLTIFDAVESQQQLLVIEDENILLAKENLEISMERLRLGQATALEFRLAEESYEDSRTRLVSIRYNLKVAETKVRLLLAEL